MVNLNPKDYDYLWTDYDVNFIFVSCYLCKNFRETDFLLIYEPEKNSVAFFITKEARRVCAEYGTQFYQQDFSKWKEEIKEKITQGKEIIQQTEAEKSKVSLMDNKRIKKSFNERVNLFQELGNLYFYTEFFFLDKIEEQRKQKKESRIEESLKKIGPLKLEAREVLNEFYNYKRIFLVYIEEVKKRTGRKDLEWLSYEEINSIIDGKSIPRSTREKKTWILSKRNEWQIIEGEEAEKIRNMFNMYFFSANKDIVKGVVANKGKVVGKVKILQTIFSDRIKEEMKKVQKGDIVVANTTGPEVMPAIEKAGAIVTDEGGITSHAAIVSRELGIPCIVGTKIASHIFKDGDLVEVDAEYGVIRKLK